MSKRSMSAVGRPFQTVAAAPMTPPMLTSGTAEMATPRWSGGRRPDGRSRTNNAYPTGTRLGGPVVPLVNMVTAVSFRGL